MIEGLKPYAEYKESDIPWAPVIPSTWQTERAKRLFTKMQRPVRPEDDVVTCFRDGMVTLRKNRRLRGFTEATVFSGYQGIRKGDLVIHGMDAFAGAIGVSDSDGKGTPVYNVCKPGSGVVASYYAHTVREMSRSQWILALAKGIRERSTDFRYEMFGNQIVPLPPPDEQAAIVRFLDHANRKIDGFIRAKRKLIGLLNEQKQAIIHRAVTGKDEVRMVKDENGNSSFILQPSTLPKKPSGIPWLGDIPQHWEVRRAKYLVREVDDRSKEGKETHLAMSQRLGLVPSSMVDSAMRSESYAGAKLCQEGDLVLNRLKAHLGVFALAKQGGVISPDYSVFRRRAAISMEYYESVLKSSACRRELRIRAKGLVEGFWRLYTDDFYDIRLPVPPLDEQKEIMSAMTVETADLTTAIARTEREIALMQEYRTRLTADLVTGKLDVREAAAKLPDLPADTSAEEELGKLLEEPEAEEEE
jgi:type I restriction enzyme S subunit